MTTRRRYNWPELIAQFEQSGQSQSQFCKQHNLNAKYFSLKLSKLRTKNSGSFVKAHVEPEIASPQGLTLQIGRCKIHCPEAMTVHSFVSLVNALA